MNSDFTPNSVYYKSKSRTLWLILAAAILHVAVTSAVLTVGKAGLLPSQFDANGLGTFASDGVHYQTEVVELREVLKTQRVVAWATWPTQLHVRIYSLPVAVLGARFNVLTIEPVNLCYYLAILILVFKLGVLVFNPRAGFIAAATVAVWPSLLLHTTQLLRDPLLIVAMLTLALCISVILTRDYRWHRGLLIGLAGAAAIVLIRIVRLPMWSMLWVMVVLALLMLIGRLVSARKLLVGNIVFGCIIVGAMVITPHFQSVIHNQQVVRTPRTLDPETIQKLPIDQQIAVRREGFNQQINSSGDPVPSDAGSDIDHETKFSSVGDIVRQVPRAIVVGFFAPFPNMWLNTGKQVGGGGRLLSGFETLVSYVIECLALFALWRQRKQVSAWFLFLVMTIGAVALGMVVANVGALYRLRYPFWALLIILGAGGADCLLRRRAIPAPADHGVDFKESPGTVLN